jgi:chromosome segregation ATPase
MAKKNPAKKTRTINQQLTSLERLVRSGFRRTDARFQQVDARFRQVDARFQQIDTRFRQVDRRLGLVQLDIRKLRKEMNARFAVMEDRIDRLATHVDGFMKLHETLDIEVRVMKEQMKRFEERLGRVEAAQRS